MKPIWYFVGLILLVMGIIILISGIYMSFNPPETEKVLSEYRPELWWGGVMTVAGAIYFLMNRRKKLE